MVLGKLPVEYVDYVFYARRRLLERIARGEQLSFEKLMVEFTRTTPVVITYGPRGLSGSVKMVGLVPRNEYIEELAGKAEYYAYEAPRKGLREVAKVLLEEFYREEVVDFTRLGGLEMAFNHSWWNIRATGKATLLFYTPPDTSYEVRCRVEVHEEQEDPYKRYMNALHDLYHRPRRGRSNYPTYVFVVEEIYDQSSTREGFGRKIYP